jgi:DNA-binding IclR family transcriptional regulator
MSSKFTHIPDEIYFLCILHNIGATDSNRALTLEEIARWTATDLPKAEENITKLIENGYVGVSETSGVRRYFITVDGIRKVLSMYS